MERPNDIGDAGELDGKRQVRGCQNTIAVDRNENMLGRRKGRKSHCSGQGVKSVLA